MRSVLVRLRVLLVPVLIAGLLPLWVVATAAPTSAYSVNTATPTGAAGGTTSSITNPSGVVQTLTLTGQNTVSDVTSTMGTTGSSAALFSPQVPTTTPSFRVLTTPPGSCALGATCSGLGTVNVTWSQPVTNPVVHVYGIGAASTQSGGRATRGHAILTLASSAPAGASLGALNAAATNLKITGSTIDTNNYNNSTACNTLADATPNAAALAGCGSIPINGTVTSITFNVSYASVAIGGSTAAPSADAFGLLTTFDEDFGDAPASYDPTQAASHIVGDLKLGSTIAADNTNVPNATTSPNAVAAGANANAPNGDGAEEDAFTAFR